MRKTTYQGFLLLMISSSLIACSTARLSYPFLDNLIRWEISKYVTIQGSARRNLNQALEEFHHWHRHTQLPLYAAFIRRQQRLLEQPGLNEQQISQEWRQAMQLVRNSARQLAPAIAELLLTLNEQQIQELLENYDKKTREYHREHYDLPPARRDQKRTERMLESMEKWLGSVSEAQRQRITEWSLATQENITLRKTQWSLTRQAFTGHMNLRQRPDVFATRIKQSIVTPETHWTAAYKQYVDLSRWEIFKLLTDLHRSLTPQQKRHLIRRLERYRQDFLHLAHP